MSLETLGKFLVGLAIVLLVTGGALYMLGKLGLMKLPGDILYRRGHVTVFFPIVTMLVLSLILTIVINLVLYFLRGR